MIALSDNVAHLIDQDDNDLITVLLDGEWVDTRSRFINEDGTVGGSGDGIPGGAFEFRFNVVAGDANGDNIVNEGDLNIVALNWQQRVDGRAGDANNDGFVDAADLNILALNWQRPVLGKVDNADFNGDGFVDAVDLNLLSLNWQQAIFRRNRDGDFNGDAVRRRGRSQHHRCQLAEAATDRAHLHLSLIIDIQGRSRPCRPRPALDYQIIVWKRRARLTGLSPRGLPIGNVSQEPLPVLSLRAVVAHHTQRRDANGADHSAHDAYEKISAFAIEFELFTGHFTLECSGQVLEVLFMFRSAAGGDRQYLFPRDIVSEAVGEKRCPLHPTGP